MNRLLVDGYRLSRTIKGAMPRKSFADDCPRFPMGDYIIETELHPFQLHGPCVNTHGVIIVEGPMETYAEFDDRVYIPALLYFPVGICRMPHQRGASEFKVTKIIRVIHHRGTVRVGIQCPHFRSVPDEACFLITDITVIVS
jgi:hypothetical protein